jgi:eukaryotic-like serine/threonine-protein kinase
MKLDEQTWKRVYPWLDKAQDVPAADLPEWIARLVAENPEVGIPLREVLSQSSLSDDDEFLRVPLDILPKRQSRTGQYAGAYTLDRLLAEGGMGEVWLAHRNDGQFEGTFAVKLLNLAAPGAKALDRFKREGRVLARLTHPYIARLIDAGATSDGQPFLVLEFIDGQHIDQYCQARALATHTRVKLFLDVLAAVSHAHTSLIIHRDIKPSNVLVTPDGTVKLLDFGIAKLIDPELTLEERGQLTRIEEVALTPSYAAPEQILGEPLSTATDVYQLGVLLHVLLTGQLPRGKLDATRSERVKAALGEPSVRMSDVVSGALRNELKGDLDAIVEKALRQRPQERYATAAALSADLQRYLEHEPVFAREGMLAYRAGKFVRRYRSAVISVTAVLASLMIATVVALTQEHKIGVERDRADQITGFMTQIFKVADPSEARGNTVTAREILDKSSRQIETGAGLDAGVQSDLLQVMAETYTNLGLYARGHTLAQSALDSRRRLLGAEDPKTLGSRQQMANILIKEGRPAEAETLLKQTLALQLKVLGPEHVQTLTTQDALIKILLSQGHYEESAREAQTLIAAETRTLGPSNPLTLQTILSRASALRRLSRFEEAEPLFRDLVATARQHLGNDHPQTIVAVIYFANMLMEQNRYREAEPLLRDALAAQQRVLGPEHPVTADTMTHLGIDLVSDRSRYPEAEQLYRAALAIELRQVGPEHSSTTRAEEGLAGLLGDEHQYAESEQLYREVLRVRLKVLGPDHTDTLVTQLNLAMLTLAEGKLQEAEKLFRATLEKDSQVLDADDRDVLSAKFLLAETLLQEHRPQEAEQMARQAFEAQLRLMGPIHSETLAGLNRLGRSLAALGRYDDANALYMNTIDKLATQPKADSSKVWYAFAVMAAQSGHADDAFSHLEQAAALGYKDAEALRSDDDLKTLHGDSRFAKLVERVQSGANPASR